MIPDFRYNNRYSLFAVYRMILNSEYPHNNIDGPAARCISRTSGRRETIIVASAFISLRVVVHRKLCCTRDRPRIDQERLRLLTFNFDFHEKVHLREREEPKVHRSSPMRYDKRIERQLQNIITIFYCDLIYLLRIQL